MATLKDQIAALTAQVASLEKANTELSLTARLADQQADEAPVREVLVDFQFQSQISRLESEKADLLQEIDHFKQLSESIDSLRIFYQKATATVKSQTKCILACSGPFPNPLTLYALSEQVVQCYRVLLLESSHASREVTAHYESYIHLSQRLESSQVNLGNLEYHRIRLAKKLGKYQKAWYRSTSALSGLQRRVRELEDEHAEVESKSNVNRARQVVSNIAWAGRTVYLL